MTTLCSISSTEQARFAARIDVSAIDKSASLPDLLAHLGSASLEAEQCVRPLEFSATGPPPFNLAEQAGFEAQPAGYLVAYYPTNPIQGPIFHCRGGVGFAIEPGEKFLRPWKPLGVGDSGLSRDGMRIKISAPRLPMKRVDPENAREHPLSLLHKSNITYYESRGIGPPHAPPGVREDGSWEVELGKEARSRLLISFPASASTFGFSFLERLEFVDQNDPRCQ